MITSINSASVELVSFLTGINPIIVYILVVWSLIWTGLALWKASSLRQKWWFIFFLLIHTMGILEIIYYFFVSKNYEVEVVEEK